MDKTVFARKLSLALSARGINGVNEAGRMLRVPHTTVSRWLAGETIPTPERVIAVARVLNDDPAKWLRLAGYDELAPLFEDIQISQPAEEVPLVGRVHAGEYTFADEDIIGKVAVPTDMARRVDFCLRVEGECMYPILLEGDIVGIRKQDNAKHNDIVLACVDPATEEMVLRVYVVEGEGIELRASNPLIPPIKFPPTSFQIIGVVQWMIREFSGNGKNATNARSEVAKTVKTKARKRRRKHKL